MKFPAITSWKTSVSGLVAAVAIFISASGFDLPTWARKTLEGLKAVAVLSMGASAKDFNVHGEPPKAEPILPKD
jgi:hypothetical protein